MRISAIALVLGVGLYAAKEPGAPQYDAKTEMNLACNIVRVYESGGALAGVFAKVETKNEVFEVYFAPANFVTILDIPLKNGLKDVEIIGSKVNFEGRDLILARELRIGKTAVYSFRDKNGNPNWLWATKSLPTGD